MRRNLAASYSRKFKRYKAQADATLLKLVKGYLLEVEKIKADMKAKEFPDDIIVEKIVEYLNAWNQEWTGYVYKKRNEIKLDPTAFKKSVEMNAGVKPVKPVGVNINELIK